MSLTFLSRLIALYTLAHTYAPPMPGHPLFPQYLELFPSGAEFTLSPLLGMPSGATFACCNCPQPSSLVHRLHYFKKHSNILLQWWRVKSHMFNRIFLTLWGLVPVHLSRPISFHLPPCSVCRQTLAFPGSWGEPRRLTLLSHRASSSLCLREAVPALTFMNPRLSECSLLHTLPAHWVCPFMPSPRL